MFLLLAFFFILILLGIIKPKSTQVFYVLLSYMWFLSAFCYQHADYVIYQTRYVLFSDLASSTEPGYTLIMYVFNLLGFDFQSFLVVIYAAIYLILGWFIKKNSTSPAFVLALYAMSTYCIDAVQLRNTMAFSIILIGLNYLLNGKGIKAVIIYIVFVFAAVLVHFSSIIYILLVIPKLCSVLTDIIITICGVIIGFVFTNKEFIYAFLANFVTKSKLDSIYNYVSVYSDKLIFNIRISMIGTLIVACVIMIISLNNLRIYNTNQEIETICEKVNFILKASIIVFVTVSLLGVSADIYRVQRYLIILLYLAMSYCVDKDYRKVRIINSVHYCNGIVIDSSVYRIIAIAVSLVFFLVQIILMGNLQSTFISIFKNNLLI